MTLSAHELVRPVAFRQRGLTMMELLVTIAILSLLMAGLSQLVVTNSQNANATGALARIADTGRTAIQLLSADIRRAGYMGGNKDILDALGIINSFPGVASTVEPNCAEDTTWARMIDQFIFGLNDTNKGYACIKDQHYTRGDILTLRYAAMPPIKVKDMQDNRLYLRATVDKARLLDGAHEDDPRNKIEDDTVRDYELVAHTYFIGPTGRTCQGIEIPALFRKVIGDDGLPLVEPQELLAGVENLQFRYLIGNRYYDANDESLTGPGKWPRVDAVEITVLVRAECPEAGFDINRTFDLGDIEYIPEHKGFRRQVFTTTTRLRN